jgi:hypothetical protein
MPEASLPQDVQVTVALRSEYVSAGQNTQALEPLTFLKVPIPQALHSPPSGPVYPNAQTQKAAPRAEMRP